MSIAVVAYNFTQSDDSKNNNKSAPSCFTLKTVLSKVTKEEIYV